MESLKKLEKRYPWGSYCVGDKNNHIVVIPCPKGYIEKARARYGRLKYGGTTRVNLRTGRDEVV